MNTLVLIPGSRELRYSFFGNHRCLYTGIEHSYGGHTAQDVAFALRLIKVTLSGKVHTHSPHAIVMRMVHGANEFAGPVRLDTAVRARLERLVPILPSRVPVELQLLDRLADVYPSVPIILFFETSFFLGLRPPEFLYGIPADISNESLLRRYGLHGLFHARTSQVVAQELAARGKARHPRIISICLEPKPELAAVFGTRPVMSTGGATPLEGLPGEHICGDLDPGVILHLVRQLGWAPEKLSDVLMNNSGLCALADRNVSLSDVLADAEPQWSLARDVLRYRLLQACGAAIATLRGIDAFGYSGRYSDSAAAVHSWLLDHLPASIRRALRVQEPLIVEQDLPTILVDSVRSFLNVEATLANAPRPEVVPRNAASRPCNGGNHAHH